MYTFTGEQRDFLLYGTRTGKLATIRKDGRPHVVPIWFTLDGDTIVFMTGEHTVKAASIRRDSHVCLCVDDETPPYAYSMVEGTATLSDDLVMLRRWATLIGGV
ncbi:MAG: PPOX class F420-dependent oxidoreductase [Ktedonobacteraceae bacterium]